MTKKRVLLVGPFPPPIGGDTVLTLNLSKSRYWHEHGIEIDCVDTSPGDRVHVVGEKLAGRDVVRGARIVSEVLWKLPRCGVVLIWANNRFVLTAGLVIILCCGFFRKPVLVKVFGASFVRYMNHLPPRWKGVARMILGRAAVFLPETGALARELVEDAGFPPDRVLLLPNFLLDGSFSGRFTTRRFSGDCVFFGQIKREKRGFRYPRGPRRTHGLEL